MDHAHPPGSTGPGWGEFQKIWQRRQIRLVVGAMCFLGSIFVPLFRETGARSWRTVYAEDGFTYFQQARRVGAFAVLFRGYHGYLQLPPRLLAIGATAIPIHYLSVYLAAISTFIAALLAWFAYHATADWIRLRLVRLALASLVVLMPLLGFENTANITNVIWIFLAVLPWAIVSLSERPADTAIRSVIAFLAATATEISLLFIPLAIGWLVFRKSRSALIVVVAFMVGVLVQGVVDLRSTAPIPPFGEPVRTFAQTWNATGRSVFGEFLIGNNALTTSVLAHEAFIVGYFVIFAIIFVALLIGADHRRQVMAGLFVGYAIVLFLAPALDQHVGPPRYGVAPVFLLASAVAMLISTRRRTKNRWIRRVGPPIFIAQTVILILAGFSLRTYRSEFPDWSSSVANTYAEHCVEVPTERLVMVRTDLLNYWPVTLPCADLSP